MILAVVQARTSSSRLPGKVLLPILGEPMLARQVERIRRARSIDVIVVATSTAEDDDALAEMCEQHGIDCCRGPLDDVLARFQECALHYQPDHVVRLTGDCPLADPAVIDQVVGTHLQDGNDYTSNTLVPTFPDGLDVEVMRAEALASIARSAVKPSEREHVTPGIWGDPASYRLGSVMNDKDLSALRWTVDEPDDLEFVRRVYAELHPMNPRFSTADVLDLMEADPSIAAINSGHRRNEGYEKSLREEGAARRLAGDEIE